MDKYTKAVLTVIALCVLALPVKAEEKVWYCEMKGHTSAQANGDKKWALEKFKMKVTESEVIFGSGGYFDDYEMKIDNYFDQNGWTARSYIAIARFENNLFFYSHVT